MFKHVFVLAIGLVSISFTANAGKSMPDCLDKSRRAIRDNNNEEVLRWKVESENQFHERALIKGVLVGTLLDRPSHLQLEVDLTPESKGNRADHIEIIYNKEFGAVTNLKPGMEVIACGDYITAREQAGPYKPSPVGAIVHWVHRSNNQGKHSDGYLSIGGELYGQGKGIVTE